MLLHQVQPLLLARAALTWPGPLEAAEEIENRAELVSDRRRSNW